MTERSVVSFLLHEKKVCVFVFVCVWCVSEFDCCAFLGSMTQCSVVGFLLCAKERLRKE